MPKDESFEEIKADRRALMTENHELWREIEQLRGALRLWLIFKDSTIDDAVQMILNYENALKATRAALDGEKTNG
jgi:regulator of replication initiation timing